MTRTPRLARTRAVLVAVAIALAVGIGLLGWRAAATAEREQQLLHEAVAERVFDEVERELTELVRTEEARPFGHWRHLYVPDAQVRGQGVYTSPLAALPDQPHLVGYFQYDPDGTLRSPHVLGPDEAAQNELALANPVAAEDRVAELARLTADITGYADATPPPVVAATPRPAPRVTPAPRPVATPTPAVASAPAPVAVAPAPIAVVTPAPVAKPQPEPIAAFVPEQKAWPLALNNAAEPRKKRVEQRVQAPEQQIQTFAPTNMVVQQAFEVNAQAAPEPEPAAVAAQAVARVEPIPEPVQAQAEPVRELSTAQAQIEPIPEPVASVTPPAPEPAPPPRLVAPAPRLPRPASPPEPTPPDRQLDVVLSPIEVSAGPDDSLRFTRTVRIGAQTWVQGVVFRQDPLRDWLVDEALGATEPIPYLALSWTGPTDAPYRYAHRFDEPFEAWTLHAGLSPEPSGGLSPQQAVLALTLLALIAALVGLAAADRTTAASVAWAQQRDDFVSAVTHELKTPLTAIQMYAEMLDDGVVDDEARRARYYRTIHGEAARLGRLIDEVLQFSQLDAAGAAPVATGTAGEALARVLALAEAHDAPVRAQIDDTAREVPVPTDLVVQVLTNLIDNAAKFGAGSEIGLTARRTGDGLVLVVTDSGPGVDPGFLARMFEPFVRGGEELTRETRGTGLGLALVKALVTQAGGTVRAANREGGGLAITVVLPA